MVDKYNQSCYVHCMDKVIIKFWGNGCLNCKAIAPTIDALRGEYKGKIEFREVNTSVDDDMVQKYNITTLPALVFEKNGVEVGRLMGLKPKSLIVKKIDEVF